MNESCPIRMGHVSCDVNSSHMKWLIHNMMWLKMTHSHVTRLKTTHSCVTWLKMTHSCVTWLTHMWRDSFKCDVTHSNVTWLIYRDIRRRQSQLVTANMCVCACVCSNSAPHKNERFRRFATRTQRLFFVTRFFFWGKEKATVLLSEMCSVMLCVAVCCGVLQCVAVCCSVLRCVAVSCGLW